MSSFAPIETALKQEAVKRYERFGQTPVASLMSASRTFRVVSEAQLALLMSKRDAVRHWFRQLEHTRSRAVVLNFFASRTLGYLYRHHQFLIVPDDQKRQLRHIYGYLIKHYGSVVEGLKSGDALGQKLETVMSVHQQRLMSYINEVARHNGGLAFVLSEPVCSQYSAELQFSLLNLLNYPLMEPVLDLGCGEDAHLVHYLEDQGRAAFGVDRSAHEAANVVKQNWFDFNFASHQWGTIISHMAFSTHFLHHHLRSNGQPEDYARQFMAILQSLKVGGCFIYTPGLPFMENLLPADKYRVEIRDFDRAKMSGLHSSTDMAALHYTTFVTRIG